LQVCVTSPEEQCFVAEVSQSKVGPAKVRVVSAGTYIGTSGWHYDHWKGPFYSSGLPEKAFLQYYAGSFGTAEINNSFYRLPERKTLLRWRSAVPEDFVFSVKASRYLTHMKKLKDPKEPLERLFDRVDALEDKLGPILFQLPPRWRSNPTRLEGFLEALLEGKRYAFEFRDRSWFDEKNYELLKSHGSAFCVYDLDGTISPEEITADFAYVRLHGPDGPYRGRYGAERLARWAGTVSAWLKEGLDVYCYFDNDEAGYGALDALELARMMEEVRKDIDTKPGGGANLQEGGGPTRDRGREPVQYQGVPGRRAHCERTLAHGDFGARLT